MILSFLNNSIRVNSSNSNKRSAETPAEEAKKPPILIEDIVKNSAYAIAIINSDLNILFSNKSFNDLFHIKESQNETINFEEAFRFGSNHSFLNSLKKHCNPSNTDFKFISFKTSFSANSNSEQESSHFVLLRAQEATVLNQRVFGLLLTAPEITTLIEEDLKSSLLKAEENLKKLEELDKLKSEFLATCSHELKTPLVSIKGYLDLISSEKLGPLSDKQQKALNVSLRNAENLNSLISSMLNFARMEAGKLRFDLIPQKIGSLLKDTAESIKPISDNKGIKIKIELEEDLPHVIIDTALLNRVLLNILENAIKFSPKDSEIVLKAGRASQQYVQVELIDQGIGIAPEQIEKIKNPFFQIDKSDTRRTGGLGLGLAIAERILIGHGTTLHIDSEEGNGTSVSFNLSIKEMPKGKKTNPFE
jgi:signal transduction histidine kinase